jgi:hypothetical protein
MLQGKNADIFQGSVLDKELFKRFADNSIDNVFFANMFATVLAGDINQTRKARQEVIRQAIRIARKNVIINDNLAFDTKIYIEQKYRALFYEDYANYFKGFENQGSLLMTPKFIIFKKGR